MPHYNNQTERISQSENESHNKIRIVIAEAQKVVREGLRSFLATDTRLEIVGEASTGEEALKIVASEKPDVLLLDLLIPGKDGFTVLAELAGAKAKARALTTKATSMTDSVDRATLPLPLDVAALVITEPSDKEMIAKALRCGARGYLPKTFEPEELCAAIINIVKTNQIILAPKIALILAGEGRPLLHSSTLTLIRRQSAEDAITEKSGEIGGKRGNGEISTMPKLTSRELEILQLVGEGLANKEIANRLYLSEGTIKTHVSIILSKLGIQSRTQAALQAVKLALPSPDSLSDVLSASFSGENGDSDN